MSGHSQARLFRVVCKFTWRVVRQWCDRCTNPSAALQLGASGSRRRQSQRKHGRRVSRSRETSGVIDQRVQIAKQNAGSTTIEKNIGCYEDKLLMLRSALPVHGNVCVVSLAVTRAF